MGSSDDAGSGLGAETITRSELIRRGAAAGVGLAGLGALAGSATAAPARREAQAITLNVWKAPHSAQDAQFMNKQFAEYKRRTPTSTSTTA